MLTLNLAVTNGIVLRTGARPAGMVPAVVVESGHMGRPWGQPPTPHQKHMHCAIYEPDTAAKPIPIPRHMWDAYVEDRNLTRGISTRRIAEGHPLFYLLDDKDNLVFFGPTMMFRLPYQRSVHDLIPQQLRDPLLIDYADALFGFVRDPKDFPDQKTVPLQGQKSRAYASRVFVTDATLATQRVPQDIWLMGEQTRTLTPNILATPKPTSFQHYLVQPDITRPHLSHYDSPQEDAEGQPHGHQTVIRGHKLYWHQGDKTADDLSAKYTGGDPMIRSQFVRDTHGQLQVKETSTQHTRFKPVKAGVEFTFRLYFENLSQAELGALCWILQPLGESPKEYCHSLGMGKPFGMGAVHLNATLSLTSRTTRYTTLFTGDSWETGVVNRGDRLSARSEQVTQLTGAFEQDILNKLQPLNVECHRLAELQRIGMLLTLMEWPMPLTPQETTYMVPSESKERPVLPDPAYHVQNSRAVAVPVAERVESDQQTQVDSSSTASLADLGQIFRANHTADTPRVTPSGSQRPRKNLGRVVLTTAIKNGKAQGKLEGGDVEFACTKIPSYFNLKVGDHCHATVTYNGDMPVSAVFKERA